jgi:hypothetical protein
MCHYTCSCLLFKKALPIEKGAEHLSVSQLILHAKMNTGSSDKICRAMWAREGLTEIPVTKVTYAPNMLHHDTISQHYINVQAL